MLWFIQKTYSMNSRMAIYVYMYMYIWRESNRVEQSREDEGTAEQNRME